MTTHDRDWFDQAVSDAYAKQREALADEAPPVEIDSAIRAAAHSAVTVVVVPTSLWRPRMERWQMPMALAATVVLSASLMLAIRGEYPDLLSTSPPEPKLRETKPMNTRIIEPPPPAAMAEKRLREPVRQAWQAGEQAAAADQLASRNDSAAKREWGEPIANGIPAERAVPAPPPPPAAALTERRMSAPATSAAPVAPASPPVLAQSAAAPTPTGGVNRAEAPVATGRADAAKAKSSVTDASVAPAQESNVFNNSPAAAKPATGVTADKVEKPQVTRGNIAFSEAEITAITSGWIAEMEALRKQGKWKELRVQKERFAKRFPKVVLPKDLQELPADDK